MVLTVWLAGLVRHRCMVGYPFLSGARTTQPSRITAVLVHRVHGTALLGDVLMHLRKGDTRHDSGTLLIASNRLDPRELLNKLVEHSSDNSFSGACRIGRSRAVATVITAFQIAPCIASARRGEQMRTNIPATNNGVISSVIEPLSSLVYTSLHPNALDIGRSLTHMLLFLQ